MSRCEIGYVDEIAFASPIGGRVIRAEDLQWWTAPGCGIDRKRYEMSFGMVPFAKLSVWICSAGVEVAQKCNVKIPRDGEVLENLLAHQFGMPIRADWLLWCILSNRQDGWNTITRART